MLQLPLELAAELNVDPRPKRVKPPLAETIGHRSLRCGDGPESTKAASSPTALIIIMVATVDPVPVTLAEIYAASDCQFERGEISSRLVELTRFSTLARVRVPRPEHVTSGRRELWAYSPGPDFARWTQMYLPDSVERLRAQFRAAGWEWEAVSEHVSRTA